MEQQPTYYEIDLLGILKKIIGQWKITLIAIVAGGVIALIILIAFPPKYSATATVHINKSQSPIISSNLKEIFESDVIARRVTEITKEEYLPDVSFVEKQNIISITVETHDPERARMFANLWADQILLYFGEIQDQLMQNMEDATVTAENLDEKLFSYLEESGLTHLHWGDLVYLVGAGIDSSVNLSVPNEPVGDVELTTEQKIRIASLLREKMSLEWNQAENSKRYLARTTDVDYDYMLLQAATDIDKVIQKQRVWYLALVPMGGMIGLLARVLLLMLAAWWKASDS